MIVCNICRILDQFFKRLETFFVKLCPVLPILWEKTFQLFIFCPKRWLNVSSMAFRSLTVHKSSLLQFVNCKKEVKRCLRVTDSFGTNHLDVSVTYTIKCVPACRSVSFRFIPVTSSSSSLPDFVTDKSMSRYRARCHAAAKTF